MTKNHSSTSRPCDDDDEHPEITQADLDRAAFRIALRPAPRRKRSTNSQDANLTEYFEPKAGKRDYQTLIDEIRHRAGE